MPKEKLRKGSHMETVKKLSEPQGLDVKEYTKDIVASGIGYKVYGQTFTDPQDAEQLKKKRIRESRAEVAKEFVTPNTPISEVTKENSGVLDARIAKSEKILPEIREEISKIDSQLSDSNQAPYKKGRLERDIEELKVREKKHENLIHACIDRLNELFGSGE